MKPNLPLFLGVNIDHVATLRQVRGTRYPHILEAALLAEEGGADGITVHLREERRHIQDEDIYQLQRHIGSRLNFEMAATEEMLQIACDLKPAFVCLVPEKRHELTTEGGLDVCADEGGLKIKVERLQRAGIQVSLFIDPDLSQVSAAHRVGAPFVELHTGAYAELPYGIAQHQAYERIAIAAAAAHQQGLIVNAGHGLHYHNSRGIAEIPVIHELNIGHSIVARAVMTGLKEAVREMKHLMVQARGSFKA